MIRLVGLMERAICVRMRSGVDAAADWLEKQGFPRELAVFALVGSRHSWRYGARPGLFWQRRGKRDAV